MCHKAGYQALKVTTEFKRNTASLSHAQMFPSIILQTPAHSTLDIILLVQCQVNLVAPWCRWFALWVPKSAPWPGTWCDVLNGACERRGAINSRTESNKHAPFQSQRSKESAVWLFFQSPGAQSAAIRWTPARPLSQQLVWGKEGGGVWGLALNPVSGKSMTACCSDLLSELEATDTWDRDEDAEMLMPLKCFSLQREETATPAYKISFHHYFHASQTPAWIRMSRCSRCL